MSESLGNKTIAGVFWSLIQRFGVMFVTFIANMILARILSPDDFGMIGMLLIFLSVANTFVDGGFASALIQKKNPTHQEYSTIFYWNLIISLFFILLLYVSAPSIAGFYRIPLLSEILRVQGWVLLINAFSIVQQNILVKRMQFKKLALINLVANIISVAVAIKLAYSGYGVWSLVYKNLLSAFLIACICWISSKWKPSWIFDLKAFRSLGGFGIMVLFSNLVETIYTEFQGLIIGRAYSARDLGFYTQAKRLEEVPTLGITSAINQVSFPLYSQLQDDYAALKNMLRKNIRFLSFINIPIYCILILIAQPLIVLLFSDKWLESVPYFKILCFAGMIYPMTSLNTNIIKSLGRGKLYFSLQSIKRGIGIVIIIIASRFGINILMWALVLVSYMTYGINAWLIKKILNYSYTEQLKDILPSVVISFALFLLFDRLMACIDIHEYLLIIFVALFYAVSYISLSLILGISVFSEFVNVIKRYIRLK